MVRGTKYDACVVPGISWSFGKRVSFYRSVFSLTFDRFRYRYTEVAVFLIVSFSNDNSEAFGTISIPTIFLSTFLTVLVLRSTGSAQITQSTFNGESIVLCLHALETIPIRELLNLALPSWGRRAISSLEIFAVYMYV